MNALGIEKTWLLTWEAPLDETEQTYNSVLPSCLPNERGPIPFERCLSYIERAPERFVLGYAPDPRRPDGCDRLAAAVDIYGVRVCGEVKLRMMYDDLDAIRMYRYCGKHGLPVVFHIDYEFDTGARYPRPSYWYGGGIEPFERAVAKCPETIFLGHGPGFWAHISGDGKFDKEMYPSGPVSPGGRLPEMMRRYPNLYCDLSAGSGRGALERDRAFAVDFLSEFADRVLYARDCFDNKHQELLDSLGLPEDVLNRIYAENALRLVPPA
jgi:hypothetical protein